MGFGKFYAQNYAFFLHGKVNIHMPFLTA